MVVKLSPSSLSLFTECPRCFWLSMNGIKQPGRIFPSLPSGFDSMLKKHFDSHREKGTVPEELDGVDAQLFGDKAKLKEWQNNFKGLSWQDGDYILRGAVDEILEKDGKLIVLDFKTRGFPLKEDTHEHYQDQMNIYNFLLGKMGFKTTGYAYLLFFYPDKFNGKCQVLMNSELKKMKTKPKDAEKLFRDAIVCLEGPEPKSDKECWMCGYVEKKEIFNHTLKNP